MNNSKLMSKDYILSYLRSKTTLIWAAPFLLFNFIDFLLTQYAIRNGNFTEMNPIWGQGVINLFPSVMKLLIIPAIAILWTSYMHPTISKWWLRFLALAFFLVCCFNAYSLWITL